MVTAQQKKPIIVATCGGFDPVHVGHIRLFTAAKALGDKLVVLLNNDNWLLKKKGFVFMPEQERKEIIEALEAVDEVRISNHLPNCEDMSQADLLEAVHPDVFAKGGDRRPDLDDIPDKEYLVCKKIGAEVVFNVGGDKVQSSSELVKKAEAIKKQ